MRLKSRSALLAGAILGLSVLLVPGALAAAPSADDPAATVNGLLDTIAAKDFAGVGAFVCAEMRDAAATRFDLEAQFATLGEGVDAQALFDGIAVTIPQREVTVTANDGTAATVSLTATIALDVSDEAARTFVGQLLEAQGMEVTEAVLDQYTPMLVSQLETPQDLTKDVAMRFEDGVWLICDDFGDGPAESPSPGPGQSAQPPASLAPMDPAALTTLMAAIPADLAASCEPDGYWQVPDLGPEPGEIASVDCDPDGDDDDWVSYSLFDSAASMDAFYDQQLQGMRNLGALDGPGCPEGPGEATWDHGRRFCYQPFGDDANMRWTHDQLFIMANSIRDDGDWAALEAFFQGAGPVAP